MAAIAPAKATPYVDGVNLANPQRETEAAQIDLVKSLQSAGVTVIRVPLTPVSGSLQPTLKFIRIAADHGIRPVLVIWPAYDPVVPRRAQSGTVAQWDQAPLSAASPASFEKTIGPLLEELDAEGLHFAGFEYGNEFNWTPFNGDFPTQSGNHLYQVNDLNHNPDAAALARGLDTIVPSLAALNRVRSRLRVNSHTPIILGGLADTAGLTPSTPPHPDAIAPAAVITYLRARGLDAVVDAYGIHTYFWTGESAVEAHAHLARALSFCAADTSREGRPCWLTEWGIAGASSQCPARIEDARSNLALRVLHDLSELATDRRLLGTLYFDWAGDEYGLSECGALSRTGRLVLSFKPFAPTTKGPR